MSIFLITSTGCTVKRQIGFRGIDGSPSTQTTGAIVEIQDMSFEARTPGNKSKQEFPEAPAILQDGDVDGSDLTTLAGN